eukprot:156220_1
MTIANEPCFVCTKQNGFSCHGQSNVTIHYNMWLTAYKKETNTFIPPFNITSNDNISIYAIKCAPQFCCQFQSGCGYLDSFNVLDFEYIYKAELSGICAQFRDYSVPLC